METAFETAVKSLIAKTVEPLVLRIKQLEDKTNTLSTVDSEEKNLLDDIQLFVMGASAPAPSPAPEPTNPNGDGEPINLPPIL